MCSLLFVVLIELLTLTGNSNYKNIAKSENRVNRYYGVTHMREPDTGPMKSDNFMAACLSRERCCSTRRE